MPTVQESIFEDTTPNSSCNTSTISTTAVVPGKNVIVIHPGSLYVRIGCVSDVNPVTVLHAIARKRYPGGTVRVDEMLPATMHKSPDCLKEIEESRLQVSRFLQSQNQSTGRKRYVTPPQQIAAFNRRVVGQTVNSSISDWYQTSEDVIVGDEILNLNPDAPYNIHFPMRRGEPNIHNGVGGSLTCIMDDFHTIWCHIIQYHLGIPVKNLKDYKCVLVIPDIFDRYRVRDFMNLILYSLKFGACFLVQDHVAATFGAGLNFACVVDVGHEKVSVSCVEDGLSIPHTRVRLGYGGADITQTFHWLLQKCAFPYAECDPFSSRLDAFLMQKLKHDFCHLHFDVCGCDEKTFVIRQPKKPTQRFTIQVGDECIIAALSAFYPELLGVRSPKIVVNETKFQSHFEDPFDAEYLRETSVVHTRRGAGTKESEVVAGDPIIDNNTNIATQITTEEELVVEGIIENVSQVTSTSDFVNEGGKPVGIDTAIMRCIERYGPEEARRKFYSAVLVVGGGVKFPGIVEFLEGNLTRLVPPSQRTERVEIIMSSKEIDSENTTWKGAAVMTHLESASELWIQVHEWEKYGVRLLREKSVFIW